MPAPTPRSAPKTDYTAPGAPPAPQSRAATASRRRPRRRRAAGRDVDGEGGESPARRLRRTTDDFENALSLAAMEAELKPKVLETFDRIADTYKKLRRLQDQDVENKLQERDALARAGAQATRS